MDAFYASVEQRDDPSLRGKAIAVGGGSKRGVTTTASYEARKYGVRSAMPGWKAKELCPHIIFVKPRFDAYKEASIQIRAIFQRYTDLIEPLSLDEAFLDVTVNKVNEPIATKIAQSIKDSIYKETQLTASAGVSYCKFIAKIASDIQKPNGITVIKPHRAIEFLESLPVKKFFGVGKVTAAKMESLGILSGKDLAQWGQQDLVKQFGKSGRFFYEIVRGIDNRPVNPDRVRKSLAVERTMEQNISDYDEIIEFVRDVAKKLFQRFDKSKFYGRTLTLKLKNKDFEIKSRSLSVKYPIKSEGEVFNIAEQLVNQNKDICVDLRLIGLTVTNPVDDSFDNGQLMLEL